MRGYMLGALAIILAAPALADPDPAPTPPIHVVVLPDWKRLPEVHNFMDVYPKRARDLGVEGTAVMKCRVLQNGRLKDCAVVSETPPGFGFGQAELKLAPYFLMTPKLIDGKPVDDEVTVPIRFKLNVIYATPPSPSEHKSF